MEISRNQTATALVSCDLHLMLHYNIRCTPCDTNHCTVFPLFSVPPSAQDGTISLIRNKGCREEKCPSMDSHQPLYPASDPALREPCNQAIPL